MRTTGSKHRVMVIGFDNEISGGLWDTSFNTMKQTEARLKRIKGKHGWWTRKARSNHPFESFSNENERNTNDRELKEFFDYGKGPVERDEKNKRKVRLFAKARFEMKQEWDKKWEGNWGKRHFEMRSWETQKPCSTTQAKEESLSTETKKERN